MSVFEYPALGVLRPATCGRYPKTAFGILEYRTTLGIYACPVCRGCPRVSRYVAAAQLSRLPYSRLRSGAAVRGVPTAEEMPLETRRGVSPASSDRETTRRGRPERRASGAGPLVKVRSETR